MLPVNESYTFSHGKLLAMDGWTVLHVRVRHSKFIMMMMMMMIVIMMLVVVVVVCRVTQSPRDSWQCPRTFPS